MMGTMQYKQGVQTSFGQVFNPTQNGVLTLNGFFVPKWTFDPEQNSDPQQIFDPKWTFDPTQNENLIRIELVTPNGLLIQNGLFDRMDF